MKIIDDWLKKTQKAAQSYCQKTKELHPEIFAEQKIVSQEAEACREEHALK